MFQSIEIAFLSASSLGKGTGVPLWEPFLQTGDQDADVEPFGPTAVFQALGFASQPWPKDENGQAEGVVVRHCGGRAAVCLGGRDTRTASVVGNLKPGDTVVYSTGPNQAAQLQLKEEKRQAVLVSKTASGKTMAVLLDGKNEKLQITHRGAVFEIDENGDWSCVNSGGAGILAQGGNLHLIGNVVSGLSPIPGLSFMLGPTSGQTPPTPVLLVAAQNMSPGLPGT